MKRIVGCAALALALALPNVTEAHGFHGGYHGGWHSGWAHGWGHRWGYAGWHGCGYWRCGGYYGPAPVIGAGYAPAPVAVPAPAPMLDAPPPAPACGVINKPVFDADGTQVGTRMVNTCQ